MTSGPSPSGGLPLVGVPSCSRLIDGHPFCVVGEKYLTAVVLGARALPLVIPSLEAALDPDAALEPLDGLLLTGSPSNVDPALYGGAAAREGVLADAQRDRTTLPIIRAAIRRGLPIFAICRGFQELNVAMGGTLHQHVEELPGRFDHRAPKDVSREVAYADRHPVALLEGGQLRALLGAGTIQVNSLHGQGIDRVADGLVVEATAADGTIEAVRIDGHPSFGWGFQWHPEWKLMENPVSLTLFGAFAGAVAAHRQARLDGRLKSLKAAAE
ncbi:gamma-glutamyl-gamma-aminobutyrate hydrolase family protein [Zavarzinia sp. CC-PAN008]|uniref:gamma-glutamyl-gamma-aminobutyrate hydrolase family protein n=1 Tax=Zavarzinia sp. CC-PAN008 TaxID=3243332 RepID=UPI003F743223